MEQSVIRSAHLAKHHDLMQEINSLSDELHKIQVIAQLGLAHPATKPLEKPSPELHAGEEYSKMLSCHV